MKNSNSNRSPEVDVARGIGIILVVLGHNWLLINYFPALKQVIYSFHVPLFFFLSGLVFKPQQHSKSLVYKRMVSLLKPYFIVLIAYEIYRLISGKSDSFLPFAGILYATGQSISITPLWFLPHLFMVILISNLLIKLFNNNLAPFSFIVLIVGILAFGVFLLHELNKAVPYTEFNIGKVTNVPLGLPLSLDFAMISISFFIAGYVFSDVVKLKYSKYFTLLLSIGIFMMINFLLNPRLDFNSRIYENFIPTSLAAFAGIWMTISVSFIIVEKIKWLARILCYVGSASLFILIFHGIIQGVFAYKFNSLLSNYTFLNASLHTSISILLSAGFSIGISCVLFQLINQYPKLRSMFQ